MSTFIIRIYAKKYFILQYLLSEVKVFYGKEKEDKMPNTYFFGVP